MAGDKDQVVARRAMVETPAGVFERRPVKELQRKPPSLRLRGSSLDG
jgi:hypothetical protein